MSKKEKTLKRVKTPSRRKFFKAAAATGAAAAATIAMPNVAFGAPKNFKDASSLAFWSKYILRNGWRLCKNGWRHVRWRIED